MGDHAQPSARHGGLVHELAIRTANRFEGTPAEQAKKLLASKMRNNVSVPLLSLPDPLGSLIGLSITITEASLRAYLQALGVAESDIGGPLRDRISKTYFVIHDTSSPELPGDSFPANLDYPVYALKKPQADFNRLTGKQPGKGVHMYISRDGSSVTVTDFGRAKGMATQYEIAHDPHQRNFVDIEMVQPRLADDRGKFTVGPEGGFTVQQVERLALAYVAASYRRQIWLVPAYHKNVDPGHRDDPKNFDLSLWASRIQGHLDGIDMQS